MGCLSDFLKDEMDISLSGRRYLPGNFVLPTACVGLEVELENCRPGMLKLAEYPYSQYWLVTKDGSLRNDGLEIKTNGPLFGYDLDTAVYLLSTVCHTFEPVTSYRTSVHVHLDVRDMTLEQIIKLLHLYLIYEKTLFNLHPLRINNRYCSSYHESTEDVENLTKLQADFEVTGTFTPNILSTINRLNKYSALNLKTIPTFGTVEFRHMNGSYNYDDIVRWINIIFCLKRASVYDETLDWETLSCKVSSMSPIVFTHGIFGKYFDNIDNPNLIQEVYDGLRLSDYVKNSPKLRKIT